MSSSKSGPAHLGFALKHARLSRCAATSLRRESDVHYLATLRRHIVSEARFLWSKVAVNDQVIATSHDQTLVDMFEVFFSLLIYVGIIKGNHTRGLSLSQAPPFGRYQTLNAIQKTIPKNSTASDNSPRLQALQHPRPLSGHRTGPWAGAGSSRPAG